MRMIREREKIALSSFLGSSLALFLMIIIPLSQEVAYSWDYISIVPSLTEDITKGSSNQMIDIAQSNFSYLIQSPALISLALTLVFLLFLGSILFLSIKMKLK